MLSWGLEDDEGDEDDRSDVVCWYIQVETLSLLVWELVVEHCSEVKGCALPEATAHYGWADGRSGFVLLGF